MFCNYLNMDYFRGLEHINEHSEGKKLDFLFKKARPHIFVKLAEVYIAIPTRSTRQTHQGMVLDDINESFADFTKILIVPEKYLPKGTPLQELRARTTNVRDMTEFRTRVEKIKSLCEAVERSEEKIFEHFQKFLASRYKRKQERGDYGCGQWSTLEYFEAYLRKPMEQAYRAEQQAKREKETRERYAEELERDGNTRRNKNKLNRDMRKELGEASVTSLFEQLEAEKTQKNKGNKKTKRIKRNNRRNGHQNDDVGNDGANR